MTEPVLSRPPLPRRAYWPPPQCLKRSALRRRSREVEGLTSPVEVE